MKEELLLSTTPADDIDMLMKCILQLLDGDESAGAEIPDPSMHCKHWETIGARELCEFLEDKYASAKRTRIPDEFLTEY